MIDLDRTFREAEQIPVADLWPGIVTRTPGQPPSASPGHRLTTIALALIIAILGVGLVLRALSRGVGQPETPPPTPTAPVVATGRLILPRYAALDLDRAKHPEHGGEGCDLGWRRMSRSRASLADPMAYTCGGSFPIFLGSSYSWSSLTPAKLNSVDYGSDPIIGSGPDTVRELHPGDIYAIQTSDGNVAKLQILRFDRVVKIRFVTYDVTPGPPFASPSG